MNSRPRINKKLTKGVKGTRGSIRRVSASKYYREYPGAKLGDRRLITQPNGSKVYKYLAKRSNGSVFWSTVSPKRAVSVKIKSTKRKSTKRKSTKRKSTKRKSIKRKSTKRKSTKRKSTKGKSSKSRKNKSHKLKVPYDMREHRNLMHKVSNADYKFKKAQDAYGKAVKKSPDTNSKSMKNLVSKSFAAEKELNKALKKLKSFERRNKLL